MSQLRDIKLATPLYKDIVPSTKAEVKLKPFRVGDEKVLLVASQSKEPQQMVDSLKTVIGNCVEGVKVEDLAHFDLEYLFIKLRSISVGETTNIGINCTECETENKVTVDLSKLKVIEDPSHTNIIKISDTLAFEMKYPEVTDVIAAGSDVDSVMELVSKSVKNVFYNEDTINITAAELPDLKDILNDLTTKQFEKLQSFFTTAPRLKEDITFECTNCKHTNKQTLEGLASFF